MQNEKVGGAHTAWEKMCPYVVGAGALLAEVSMARGLAEQVTTTSPVCFTLRSLVVVRHVTSTRVKNELISHESMSTVGYQTQSRERSQGKRHPELICLTMKLSCLRRIIWWEKLGAG